MSRHMNEGELEGAMRDMENEFGVVYHATRPSDPAVTEAALAAADRWVKEFEDKRDADWFTVVRDYVFDKNKTVGGRANAIIALRELQERFAALRTPSAAGTGEAVAWAVYDAFGRMLTYSESRTKADAECARYEGYGDDLWVMNRPYRAVPLYAHPPAHPVVTDELTELRAMQKEWDDYTLAQIGATYTHLYRSRMQADAGDTMTLDELRIRLTATRGSDA